MPAVKNTYVPKMAERVNALLQDGLFVRCFPSAPSAGARSTDMLQLWDRDGAIEALVIGSQAEAARYLEGMLKALAICGREEHPSVRYGG